MTGRDCARRNIGEILADPVDYGLLETHCPRGESVEHGGSGLEIAAARGQTPGPDGFGRPIDARRVGQEPNASGGDNA